MATYIGKRWNGKSRETHVCNSYWDCKGGGWCLPEGRRAKEAIAIVVRALRYKSTELNMDKTQDYWLAVGRVSDAAREQLAVAHCLVTDIQREPPIALVCLRHQGDMSKEWIWEHAERLRIPSRALDVLIRSHDADNTVGSASVVDVEITTAAEAEAEERRSRVIELNERRRNRASRKDFCRLEAGDDKE